MPFYARGDVRIHYEEVGSGFPLLIIPGGGLNSTVTGLATHPFNPMEEFKDAYRCIAADLRNANGGQSTGPLEIDHPWDAYTDDHLGLMDHLGIAEFVLGLCIGGPSSGTCYSGRPSGSSRPCWPSPAASGRSCRTSSTKTTLRAGARRSARAGPTSPWTWCTTSSRTCTPSAPTLCSP